MIKFEFIILNKNYNNKYVYLKFLLDKKNIMSISNNCTFTILLIVYRVSKILLLVFIETLKKKKITKRLPISRQSNLNSQYIYSKKF